MSDEERDAMRKVILALDYVLWKMDPSSLPPDPRELSKHRQALVDAGQGLHIWLNP